ncbi:TPA: hypothetical protein ACO4GF_004352 [Escherichia coli]
MSLSKHLVNTVVNRIYAVSDLEKLTEDILNNLKPVVSYIMVKDPSTPSREDRLLVIGEGEEQQLAYYHPFGMQDPVFRGRMAEGRSLQPNCFYAHIDPNHTGQESRIKMLNVIPPYYAGHGVAAALDEHTVIDGELARFVAYSDLGWVHLTAEETTYNHQLRRRNVIPYAMTGWKDIELGYDITKRLQRVRPAMKSHRSEDVRGLLNMYRQGDIVHPLGYALVYDVRWNQSLQLTEVKITVDGEWLPVISRSLQIEETAERILEIGYVRWDISDLAPQQTKENRNHVDETNSKGQSL